MHHPCPAARLDEARAAAAGAGLDALLISPSADLRYLTGYDALPLERLTCLVLPVDGDPFLLVPALERPAAQASPAAGLGIEITGWNETDDPYAVIATRLPSSVARVGVDNHMWAERTTAFAAALPGVRQELAGAVLNGLRMRKTPQEAAALRRAGAAIDRVHGRMGEWLRPGRTEREVGRDIADAIIAEGHVRADFVIVGSGPNSASPHHEVSDRVILPGDPVVVDIGGTTQEGYCSDSTRVYAVGEPPEEFRRLHDVLLRAQRAQTDAVRPGITAGQLDAVGRDIIADAGYGEHFVHRTGHGIGLETHEEPYIVAGSRLPLEPGMAFSVEPGIYLPDRYGARIEDIVICTEDGGERLNHTGRDLVVLPGNAPGAGFPAQVRLTGDGLVLREWTDDDLPAMAELFDDPDIAYWTPLASPFDAAAARDYLARARQERAAGLRLRLAVTTDGRAPLGEVLFIRQAADDPAVSLGYSVGAAHRGQRLGSRALGLLTHYAHHTAGLPRVTLNIEPENAASIAVARAAGYHLTDQPPISVTSKGRPLTLRTWAHDHG